MSTASSRVYHWPQVGKSLPGIGCQVCGKSVEPTACVEMQIRQIIGSSIVTLGIAMFHIDCYMSAEEDGELDDEEEQAKQAIGPINERVASQKRCGDVNTNSKAPA